MKSYTHHGQSITVPDFREASMEQVKSLVQQKKLRYVIEDSTYNPDLPAGRIIDQNPRPNSKVKQNRTIYFVVNSSTPPPVKMPDLIDNTLRQAELKISNLGLKVGKKIYQPDLAKDVVLQQMYKGKPIEPNQEILKGESIDLILGDGFGNTSMNIPDLVGLNYQEAMITLHDYGLKVGKVEKTESVGDVNRAIIYDQSPSSIDGQKLEQGSVIDIYLTALPNEI